MLTCSPNQILCGSLEQVVAGLLYEDRDSGLQERRSAHREPFMRPVTIHPRRADLAAAQAFSKNVSTNGIGLVTPEPVEVGTIAKLAIHRTAGPAVVILAECRWCDGFGTGWFVHGWNFINVARGD